MYLFLLLKDLHIYLGGDKILQITANSSVQYNTFTFRKDTGDIYSFVFNDIMGLEKKAGIHVEDLKLALRGHVKDGYKVQSSELT